MTDEPTSRSGDGEMRNPLAWLDLAAKMAEAVGHSVLIGVRPNGSWFANCDGIEWDGADGEDALMSVLGQHRRHAESQRNLHSKAERDYDERYLALVNAPRAVDWRPKPTADDEDEPEVCDTFSESGTSGLCGWCSHTKAMHQDGGPT